MVTRTALKCEFGNLDSSKEKFDILFTNTYLSSLSQIKVLFTMKFIFKVFQNLFRKQVKIFLFHLSEVLERISM